MIQLAWPLVALMVGLAFAAVLYVRFHSHFRSHAEMEAALALAQTTLGHVIENGKGHERAYRALEARTLALEDEVRNLGQRIPSGGLARAR